MWSVNDVPDEIREYHLRLYGYYVTRIGDPDPSAHAEALERARQLDRIWDIRPFATVYKDNHPGIDDVEGAAGLDPAEQEAKRADDKEANLRLVAYYEALLACEGIQRQDQEICKARLDAIITYMKWSRKRATFGYGHPTEKDIAEVLTQG